MTPYWTLDLLSKRFLLPGSTFNCQWHELIVTLLRAISSCSSSYFQ
jgi:hypothetical protein